MLPSALLSPPDVCCRLLVAALLKLALLHVPVLPAASAPRRTYICTLIQLSTRTVALPEPAPMLGAVASALAAVVLAAADPQSGCSAAPRFPEELKSPPPAPQGDVYCVGRRQQATGMSTCCSSAPTTGWWRHWIRREMGAAVERKVSRLVKPGQMEEAIMVPWGLGSSSSTGNAHITTPLK